MWYAVLRREFKDVRAGSIYAVKKYDNHQIICIPVEGASAVRTGRLTLTVEMCRTLFTRPTRDFNDAVEESFVQCEANYC